MKLKNGEKFWGEKIESLSTSNLQSIMVASTHSGSPYTAEEVEAVKSELEKRTDVVRSPAPGTYEADPVPGIESVPAETPVEPDGSDESMAPIEPVE